MSTWVCPRCGNELGNGNAWCEFCKHYDNIKIYNPDKYLLRDNRAEHLVAGDKEMTPQEEYFTKLFYDFRKDPKVNEKTDLELRALREELQEIILKGKAHVYAIDEILKERKPKGPQGFAKSINDDSISREAINTIKERQGRMSKIERAQENLRKLYESSGMSPAEAMKTSTQLTSNRLIVEKITAEVKEKQASEPQTPATNPFAKKE